MKSRYYLKLNIPSRCIYSYTLISISLISINAFLLMSLTTNVFDDEQ